MQRLVATGSSSSRHRISVSIAATTVGRLLIVVYNIVLVPIFLSAWGTRIYGEWILLTAIASMASLTNVGFAQASTSEIVMRISSGDRDEANRILSTTVVSLALLALVILIISIAAVLFADPDQAFGMTVLGGLKARIIVVLVVTMIVVGFFTGPLGAIAGAVLGAGVPQGIQTTVKACELLAICVLVAGFGGGPVAVAGVLVLSMATSCVCLLIAGYRVAPWLRVSIRLFDRNTFSRLLHPSLGYFLLFVSVNILAIQLPRLVLGRLGGPEIVAAFAVSVTYARAARVITGIVAQSSQVELSRLFSEGKLDVVARMVERIAQFSMWAAIVIAVLLISGAKPLFALWTGGKIAVDFPLVSWLLVGTIAGAYSEAFQYFLTGINRNWLVAITHGATTLFAILFAIAAFSRLGSTGMAAGLAFPEFATAAAGFIATTRLLSLPWKIMFLRTFLPPSRQEWRNIAEGLRNAPRFTGDRPRNSL